MNVELTDVVCSYVRRGAEPKPALKGATLTVGDGECVGIIGPEGAGKSTLLMTINGLLKPDSGTVRVNGVEIGSGIPEAARTRRRIGLAFQFPGEQFLRETVRDELLFGSGDGDVAAAGRALHSQGLDPEKYFERSPFQLSMGEARRVVLASILLRKPDLLLMDEPTVGLDGHGIEKLSATLKQELRRGIGVVVASHDLDFLAEHTDRIYGLDGGSVVMHGPVGSVLADEKGLARIGYDRPEFIEIHQELWKAGTVQTGEFKRGGLLGPLFRGLREKQ